ncbi:hypothetical protein JCM6882_004087 [Rhodosporidiobolus microsporus]
MAPGFPFSVIDTTDQRWPQANIHPDRWAFLQNEPFPLEPLDDVPAFIADPLHPTLPGPPGDLIVSPAVPPTDFLNYDIFAPTPPDPPVASPPHPKMGDPLYFHPMSMSAIVDAGSEDNSDEVVIVESQKKRKREEEEEERGWATTATADEDEE